MKKFRIKGKYFFFIISFVLLFSFISHVDLSANANMCEYALIQCFGDASIWDWITKAIVGQILYCLNGYGFCKEYVEPFIK
ncbi:MAG: hypothetical protein IBX60_06980 [Candidatus Aminicenantes bacterium]|nr:hypothetical protein [Candidatus Aminicenantes bacterium]